MIKVTKASAPELEGVRTEPATPLANRPPLAASLPTSPVTFSANLRLHFSVSRSSSVSDPSAVPISLLFLFPLSHLTFIPLCIHTRRLPPPRCLGAIQEWFTARRTEIPDSLGNGNESLYSREKSSWALQPWAWPAPAAPNCPRSARCCFAPLLPPHRVLRERPVGPAKQQLVCKCKESLCWWAYIKIKLCVLPACITVISVCHQEGDTSMERSSAVGLFNPSTCRLCKTEERNDFQQNKPRKSTRTRLTEGLLKRPSTHGLRHPVA